MFSPTDLSWFYKSPFVSWMERYSIENPAEKKEIAEDPTMKLLAQKGDEFEAHYLKKLKSEYGNIVEINKKQDFEQAKSDTIKAIKSGADIIYQGALSKGNVRGFTDFLVKVQRPSKLGDFSYEVADTKLARSPKPEYIIQLSSYSEMLSEILGMTPENFSIVLGSKEKIDFRVDDFAAFYRRFKKAFEVFHNEFDPKCRPIPQTWESFGVWQECADEILKKSDHLVRIAGISTSQIKKLEKAGINTVELLVNANPSSCPDTLEKSSFAKIIKQATLQNKSIAVGRTQFELRVIDTDQSYGLQRLPPKCVDDVYFDMEGFPLADDGLEYLFGATFIDHGQLQFKDWWAVTKDKEKKAFEDWIDWAYARWTKNPMLHIFHYAAYEVTAMKKLMGAYMTREHEVDEFLRHGVFIDLYQVVKEALIVGAESYSIKKLEGLYDFKRKGDVKNAADSNFMFATWIDLKD